jgi:DNA-binding NarL/FixJ family response regulator
MREKSPSPPTPARRRILIVDDHPLVRRGLTALINAEPDLTVCAEAATQRAGIEAIASSRPDLVIADLSLHDGDGLDLVREIRASHDPLPVLVLTMYDAPIHARRAFTAGASGYVTKQELTGTLLLAIRCVLRGEKYVSPGLSAGLDTA